ncbi:hypothetical protein BaRGS_00013726 [Batillaria attramentaria]|uniref:Uncharacterized protein n=1 Tax=Batillaria attramentaria TaxID=370345 RepID=A0ABD0L6D0_9CAEN
MHVHRSWYTYALELMSIRTRIISLTFKTTQPLNLLAFPSMLHVLRRNTPASGKCVGRCTARADTIFTYQDGDGEARLGHKLTKRASAGREIRQTLYLQVAVALNRADLRRRKRAVCTPGNVPGSGMTYGWPGARQNSQPNTGISPEHSQNCASRWAGRTPA